MEQPNNASALAAFSHAWQARPRPLFHITGRGWINDPCAPGYDARTKTYHMFYQWNSVDREKTCAWGHMSWGHVESKDCIRWTPAEQELALAPDQAYDSKGVFTGCFYPTGPDGEADQLSVFYTSICKLPFHWSTPYPSKPAGLALATSKDNGKTWTKDPANPILAGEPQGEPVTGFRDPYVTTWPSLSKLRNEAPDTLYGLIAGGHPTRGPTAFLYSIPPDNLRSWTYLGPLATIEPNFQPSKKWSPDYGRNWECTNALTLSTPDGSLSREFFLTGVEGCAERPHLAEHTRPPESQDRGSVSAVWLCGTLSKTNTTITTDTAQKPQIQLSYKFGGYLDHGSLYAAISAIDPVTKKQLVWGWLREEDLSLARCRAKGWNGSISLPREIFLLVIPRVTQALVSSLGDIASVEIGREREGGGGRDLLTLGVRPFARLGEVLGGGEAIVLNDIKFDSQSSSDGNLVHTLPVALSHAWRIEATISIKDVKACRRVGFHLKHNTDLTQRTSIYFTPDAEEITVDRSASNDEADIDKHTELGPCTLFTQSDAQTGREMLEKLTFTVFGDGDVVEVFVNERFALSTMVYADSRDGVAGGVSAFVDGAAESVVFEEARVWSGFV